MRYPINLKPEEKGLFSVSFPDFPEAITAGNNRDHALEMALDALITSLDFYFEDRRMVPLPSRIKRGQAFVDLPPGFSAKILLLNEMLEQEVRPAELARRMGVPPPEINRLLNLRHNTKIDTIAVAMNALGKRLELQVAAQ